MSERKGRLGTWCVGIACGVVLATVGLAAKKSVEASGYQGVSEEQAFEYLMGLAKAEAGNDSWQNINMARVYMVAGRKDEGAALLSSLSGKLEASDYIRIGRAYYDGGDWDRAEEAFEEVLRLKPKDADWLAEIGGYYNVEGDRARAEQLFEQSFDLEPDSHKNLRDAAGSYLGVVPIR